MQNIGNFRNGAMTDFLLKVTKDVDVEGYCKNWWGSHWAKRSRSLRE